MPEPAVKSLSGAIRIHAECRRQAEASHRPRAMSAIRVDTDRRSSIELLRLTRSTGVIFMSPGVDGLRWPRLFSGAFLIFTAPGGLNLNGLD